MSSFWSWYVILLVVINILGYCWLTFRGSKVRPSDKVGEGEELDHDADGIKELNYSMPRWLVWIFWFTVVFSIIYFLLYPGLGNFKGLLGWSSTEQLQQNVAATKKIYAAQYAQYANVPITQLTHNPKAMQLGHRLFLAHCSKCHGIDGKGYVGFPNLTNGNWLYGGTPDAIEESIANGRQSLMPPMGAAVGSDQDIDNVVAYVRSLNGYKVNAQFAAKGKVKFKQVCAVCHGINAKGNTTIGSPNLTNNQWIFGGSPKIIKETILHGRSGDMPEHKDTLSKVEIRVIAAYVYQMSYSGGVH